MKKKGHTIPGSRRKAESWQSRGEEGKGRIPRRLAERKRRARCPSHPDPGGKEIPMSRGEERGEKKKVLTRAGLGEGGRDFNNSSAAEMKNQPSV